jgi:glucosamine 6-phosphate synthetase-like amidotransferase/phosphosugar isomerase protein
LRLVGLRIEGDSIIADFEHPSAEGGVSASFVIDRKRGIIVTSPTPDVFAELASSIDEVRRITSAVIAFGVASERPSASSSSDDATG